MFFVMFGLFSVYPSVVDLYSGMTGTTINGISTISASDSEAGYTFVNFAFMYCIGVYIRKYDLNIKKYKCILGYIISSGAIYAIIHLTMNGLYYSNPLVILSAFFCFLCLRKVKCQVIELHWRYQGWCFQFLSYIVVCMVSGKHLILGRC